MSIAFADLSFRDSIVEPRLVPFLGARPNYAGSKVFLRVWIFLCAVKIHNMRLKNLPSDVKAPNKGLFKKDY